MIQGGAAEFDDQEPGKLPENTNSISTRTVSWRGWEGLSGGGELLHFTERPAVRFEFLYREHALLLLKGNTNNLWHHVLC